MGAVVLVVALAAFMAVVCLNVLLVVYYWDQRLPLLAGMIGFYSLLTLILGWAVRRTIRHAPPPLAATLDELKKDRAAILSDSSGQR